MGGCSTLNSETPLATNFTTTNQLKLQSGAHWSVIANDVADRIKGNKNLNGATLSVLLPTPDSDFSKAFRNQLISALVNKGLPVSKISDNKGSVVEIEAQLVKFSPNRYQNRHFVSATAIAAGIWGIQGLDLANNGNAIAGALAATAAIDWNQWANQEFAHGRTPQYELILTTSVSKGAMFVSRTTDVYYIADPDNHLYDRRTSTIKVTGDAK